MSYNPYSRLTNIPAPNLQGGMPENKRLLTNLDNKDLIREINTSSSETIVEFSVDLVASVAVVNLMMEATIEGSGGAAGDDLSANIVKQIYICPNGKLPAVNISGSQAQLYSLAKFKNTNVKIGALNRTEYYSMDFRDYMEKYNLGLPEAGQSLSIRIVLNNLANCYTTSHNQSILIRLTTQIIQDEGLNRPLGYRRYFTIDVPVSSSEANYLKKIALPRFGLLDSMIIDNGGTVIKDITISRNEIEYPLKSTWELETENVGLDQANFPSNVCFVDLIHPIVTNPTAAKTLNLELLFGGFSGDKVLHIICEYIYLLNQA